MASHSSKKGAQQPAPESKELVAQTANANALEVIDFGEDAGAGGENIKKGEFKIPMFRILQQNSPQCAPPAAGGTQGALPGMILNTVTGQLYEGGEKGGFEFIACHRDHNWVEYGARVGGKSGGFVGIWDVEGNPEHAKFIGDLVAKQGERKKLKRQNVVVAEARDGQPEVRKDTEISETYYLYPIALIDGQEVMCVLPFQSTQIPHYQAFMTDYRNNRYQNSASQRVLPPLWYHKFKLTTSWQTNRLGSYWGWDIKPVNGTMKDSRLRLDDPLYEEGRKYYDLMHSGEAVVDMKADAEAGAAESRPAGTDDEIPF